MVPLRAALALMLLPAVAGSPGADGILDAWFRAPSRLEGWTSAFTQVRHLQALTRPLTNSGHLWFAPPDRFRWELGDPVRSIAVRNGDALVLLSPRLQRAETHRLSQIPDGPLKEALALLDTGFPTDRNRFEKRFEVTGAETLPEGVRLHLVPRSADTRRFLPAVSITLDPDNHALRATEFTLADGSRVETRFHRPEPDPQPDPMRFDTSVPAGFKVTAGGPDSP